jgi:tRNA(Ile)-lysidine synthase
MTAALPAMLQALGVTGTRWAVALSGGPDSMALLHKLHALTPALQAFIVDHGLRAESASEAKFVQARAREIGVSTEILHWQGVKPQTGIQAAARQARYELLVEACETAQITHLFLAHHQDDQLETVAIRAARGSGWRGLAGMPWLSQLGTVQLVRPLLSLRKAELLDYCAAHNISYVTDPSNSNPRFARSALRAQDLSGYAAQQQLSAARRQSELEQLNLLYGAAYQIEAEGGYVRIQNSVLHTNGLLPAVLSLIGQQPYGPDAARLAAAQQRLAKGQSLTLAGCRLLVDKTETLIAREAAGITGNWQAGRWDSRWKIPATTPSGIEPLGKQPWRRGEQAKWLEKLPGAARASLPYIKESGVVRGVWLPYWQPLRQIFAIKSASDGLSAIG